MKTAKKDILKARKQRKGVFMKRFILRATINNQETGALIERTSLIYNDEDDDFESGDDFKDFLNENREAGQELIRMFDDFRQYEHEDTDLYVIDVIQLRDSYFTLNAENEVVVDEDWGGALWLTKRKKAWLYS